MSSEQIAIKTPEEIAIIRQGGRILGGILRQLVNMVKPGVTTGQLEEAAERLIFEAGGRPSFKGFCTKGETPFPTVLCTSINDEVVHAPALPSRILKEGDVVGIDVGMEWPVVLCHPEDERSEDEGSLKVTNEILREVYPENHRRAQNDKIMRGFFTDTAVTVPVGQVSKEAQRLIKVTRQALEIGIQTIKPGKTIADIGRAIEEYAKKQKVGIIRDLVGHGVGYKVHEAPRIPNFFDPELSKVEIQEGLVLALEPMFTLGDWKVVTAPDGCAIKTADGSPAAHFEHTVVVTKDGGEVVT